MRPTIIAVGKVKDRDISSLIREYSKRIKLDFIEIKDSNKIEEGKKLLEIIDRLKDRYLFVMSEEGKELDSLDFSQKLKKIDQPIYFIIGGPDGIAEDVKKKADFLLSLSKMTFTHEMARLFLVEQIYRANTIIENKNYHK